MVAIKIQRTAGRAAISLQANYLGFLCQGTTFTRATPNTLIVRSSGMSLSYHLDLGWWTDQQWGRLVPKISCVALGFVLCLSLSIALFNAALAGNQDLVAEKVIAEHLESIGSPAALPETKSRAFAGTASVKSIQGMHGSLSATSMFASVGGKL